MQADSPVSTSLLPATQRLLERQVSNLIAGLFALTAFVSSSLVFVVQPMIAKQLLPQLGGSPSVWTTCALFFQASLLAGYLWAHVGPRWFGVRMHAVLHVLLLAMSAAILLPPDASRTFWPAQEANPTLNVLVTLAKSIGLPMALVCATSPLLQFWHQRVDPSQSHRVYRLYAIGNIASLVLLLMYPLAIEPLSNLSTQLQMWGLSVGGLTMLIGLCVLMTISPGSSSLTPSLGLRRAQSSRTPGEGRGEGTAEGRTLLFSKKTPSLALPQSIGRGKEAAAAKCFLWLALSAIPSSHLLGATTFLTTDVAAIPFLWVLPLALYLAAFSLAFAGRSMPAIASRALLPALALFTLLMIVCGLTLPVPMAVGVHLALLFFAAWGCLTRLYSTRPEADGLTRFYLYIAVGGVLGGAFNSLLAPVLFKTPVEYPIAVLGALFLLPNLPVAHVLARKSIVTTLAIMFALSMTAAGLRVAFNLQPTAFMLVAAGPILLAYAMRKHRALFAWCAMIPFIVLFALGGDQRHSILTERSFFGVHRVVVAADGKNFELYHGTTMHGQQARDPLTDRPTHAETPLTYYHRQGPLGDVMRTLDASKSNQVAVVGLGVGNTAAYASPTTAITYFEIDPTVIRLASDSAWFSYLPAARARGASIQIVPGDARLNLARESTDRFDAIVLDAFSGDSIPVHLLTIEAVRLYQTKLAANGVLAFHISNRYLDLSPVLARIGEAAGMQTMIKRDLYEKVEGKAPSIWFVMTNDSKRMNALSADHWKATESKGAGLWTDDFSNLVSVIQVGESE